MPYLERPGAVKIHWEERGSGPLVVLAPYANAHPSVYDPLETELTSDHRIVRFDDRGMGQSTRTGPFDMETGAGDLAAVIDEAGGPAVVITLTDAVHRAARVAVRRPDLVEALVAPGGTPAGRARLEGSEAMVASDSVVDAFMSMGETDYRGALRSVMTAANPPDAGDKGMWVADLAAGAERGDRKHARYFFFDPLDNPHIDQAALAALAEKYDEHTFDVQVRGLFLLPPDTVLHSWDRKGNEQPMPAMGDVTRAFTKHFEGREYDDIVGVDVQNYPWIAGVRMRAYRNPEAPGDITQSLLWCVGEVFLEAGDEVDFCEGLRSIGCHPDRTLVIADATCDYQQQQRDKNKQRPKYSGKGSMDMFRGEGFVHVVPPDDQMDRNPLIEERCRAANARIKTKGGKRFVFADPKRCEKTVTSIRQWRRGPNGGPSRKSKGAHAGDALSYVLWRFFPRRRQNDKVEIKTFKRFQGTTRTRGF